MTKDMCDINIGSDDYPIHEHNWISHTPSVCGNVEICTVGWVNLYQKFEIEKYMVCGKLIIPKKMERHF